MHAQQERNGYPCHTHRRGEILIQVGRAGCGRHHGGLLSAFPAALFCLVWLLFPLSAFAYEQPVWWADMERAAARDGYVLIADNALAVSDALLLDVRPDYEFRGGHLEGAVNVEFPPTDTAGDRELLASAVQAVESLAGQNRKRTIVVYCRSFR